MAGYSLYRAPEAPSCPDRTLNKMLGRAPLYFSSREEKDAYVDRAFEQGLAPSTRAVAGTFSRPDVRWGWYDPIAKRFWRDDWARYGAQRLGLLRK